MANPDHLSVLQDALAKKDISIWNGWREKHPDIFPDLDNADLTRADLRDANLRGASLSEADLDEAILRRADLKEANLRAADIRQAALDGALLPEANLRGAILYGVDFSGAHLWKADLTNAKLWGTIFADVDLGVVKGLESVEHRGPSKIDVSTLYKSRGNLPEVFLRGCGVPDDMIIYVRHQIGTAKAIRLYSAFISYSSKDDDFVRRLHANLQTNGVRVWYFPEDAKWGEPVWGEIDRGIHAYDKLIVVCSEHSLRSAAVQREIERALRREDGEGKNILFPVRIDDYIFTKWQHPRKADVVAKVVGDFSGWETDSRKIRHGSAEADKSVGSRTVAANMTMRRVSE